MIAWLVCLQPLAGLYTPYRSPACNVLAGSRRDQQQAYFIGGSEELQDMTYMAVPSGHKGSVLNKYGYKTQTSGNVKVRDMSSSRHFVLCSIARHTHCNSLGASTSQSLQVDRAGTENCGV